MNPTGRFLAEVTKQVLSDLEASKYQVLLTVPYAIANITLDFLCQCVLGLFTLDLACEVLALC